MSDAWIRRIMMSAIALLVLHAVGTWAYAALGVAAAIASAALVAGVSVFSARMAGLGEGRTAWFLVPTLAFTTLPLVGRLWTLLTAEQTWWARTVEFAPFLFGFAAPVLLLLAVYLELGRRAPRVPRAGHTGPAATRGLESEPRHRMRSRPAMPDVVIR